MQILTLALRGLQLLFLVIFTALIGNAIQEAFGGNPPTVNYSIFVAVWCWLVLAYGFVAGFVESLAIPMVILVVDGLAILFTLVDGIALAAQLGAGNCNDEVYRSTNFLIAGGTDQFKRCRELQAGTAFVWFLFATFIATTALAFTGRSSTGGLKRGGPSMSQV